MPRRSLLWVFLLLGAFAPAAAAAQLTLEPVGTWETGIFDESAAEIAAFDPETARLFFVNGAANTVDVLDLSNPAAPAAAFMLDLSAFGSGPTSVDVSGRLIAVAVLANDPTQPGTVAFFDVSGKPRGAVQVGAHPDMLTFTRSGGHLLVANEGQPSDDYKVDPVGSVSIIDLSRGRGRIVQSDVTTVGFEAFEGALPAGVRVFGPGASVAQDLEPEYIASLAGSRFVWVTLQENNALAVVDIRAREVVSILPLGLKNHAVPGSGLDASDEDGVASIVNQPVFGMFQPDAIAAYQVNGVPYVITANEGDARDYDGFSEQVRVEDLTLDPTAFPDPVATLAALARLRTTTAGTDTDGDGDADRILAYGARSFTIWTGDGQLVFDSGDDIEQRTLAAFPADFNSDNAENGSFDDRSDDKGPEPEGLVLGRIGEETYLFLGLERIGGVMVYDVSDPAAPVFVTYVNNRDFSGDAEAGTAGDLGPEGLVFVPAHDSPTREPLLIVANEVSGSVTIFRIAAG